MPPPERSTTACPDENALIGLVATGSRDVESHVAGCAECRRLLVAFASDRSPSGWSTGPAATASAGDALERIARLQALRADLLPAGSTLGRYVIENLAGEGGMGVVYVAHDPELDRQVALKVLHPSHRDDGDDAVKHKRLLREARALAKLAHPNVVAVYDVGVCDDRVFVAMEFVHGSTLTQWTRSQKRTPREVLEVFAQAGRGLAAAHEAGLVHRDFKPDNVLLGNDGRVRVTDFGLAFQSWAEAGDAPPSRLLGAGSPVSDVRTTRTGALLGTPAYMAPEQLLGKAADARSDQFSFCVALYEALFDARPFADSETPTSADGAQLGKPLKMRHARSVSGAVRRALKRGLERVPKNRFPTMDALLLALHPASPRPLAYGAGALAGALGVVWALSQSPPVAQTSAPSTPAAVAAEAPLPPPAISAATAPAADPAPPKASNRVEFSASSSAPRVTPRKKKEEPAAPTASTQSSTQKEESRDLFDRFD